MQAVRWLVLCCILLGMGWLFGACGPDVPGLSEPALSDETPTLSIIDGATPDQGITPPNEPGHPPDQTHQPEPSPEFSADIPAACQAGERRCVGAASYALCEQGQWSNVRPCETDQTCAKGQCQAAAVCNDGQVRCQGAAVERCLQGQWQKDTNCSSSEVCEQGACVPVTPLNPCASRCWENQAGFSECSFYAQEEDFASGKYNVHQYNTQLHKGRKLLISLKRTAGTWQPTVYVALGDGQPLTPPSRAPSGYQVKWAKDGKAGDTATLEITPQQDTSLEVYVTSWAVVNSGFTAAMPQSAKYDFRMEEDCPGVTGGLAPTGALSGEKKVTSGSVSVTASSSYGVPLRIDAKAGEHIHFRLDFSGGSTASMEVLGWDGVSARSLGVTDWGPSLRVLSALDPKKARTFWVRTKGNFTKGTMKIVRTPFTDGVRCTSDCARLMQLPLPLDPKSDGYFTHPAGKYAYQFGRRDLIMLLRHAGRKLALNGYKPCPIKDYSKWDGSRPPGHASHTRGKDLDTCVVQLSQGPVWKPLCQVDSSSNCVKGTDTGFDGKGMALFLGAFLESGQITHVFLDKEFLNKVYTAADTLIKAGKLQTTVSAFKSAVQHWPNHHNHAHIRIKE